MARNRIVRNTQNTNTTFQLTGYLLTEKMKRNLRGAGLKTDEMTWAQVFPNADVVYRFNPKKNKQDVYVGTVDRVQYPSGPKVDLKTNGRYFFDTTRIYMNSNSAPERQLTYTIHANSVSRTELE